MSNHLEPNHSKEAEDSIKVTAATKREFPDPVEDHQTPPPFVLILIGAVLSFGLLYFQMFKEGAGSSSFAKSIVTTEQQETSEPSLAELGKSIYANCQACHQASGLGIPGQFPTLVGSDWVAGSEKRLIAILLKGLNGPVKVNGVVYNGAMPAWEKVLSNKKIAAVLTYVRSSWGNKFPEITEGQVAAVKTELASKADAYTEAELLAIPEGASVAVSAATAVSGASAAPAPAVDLEAGKAQYQAICIACHQPTGLGLFPVFPPLVNSEYVKGDKERLIAIVLNGVMGPIVVDGKSYANMMPAQGAVLTDAKISQVLSYVRKTFGEGASEVTADEVAEARKRYGTRATSWTEAELQSFQASH